MTNTTLPTVAEFQKGKSNLDSLEEILNGDSSTTVTTYSGREHDSIAKWISKSDERISLAISSLGYQVVGDFSDEEKVEITEENYVYTSKSVDGCEDALWRCSQTLPYTPTGSDPSDSEDDEYGKWVVVAEGELKAIARGLNILNSEVIYAADTTTELDDVLYIYDASTQTIWKKPSTIGEGEMISSVVDSRLFTTAGETASDNLWAAGDGELSTPAENYEVFLRDLSIKLEVGKTYNIKFDYSFDYAFRCRIADQKVFSGTGSADYDVVCVSDTLNYFQNNGDKRNKGTVTNLVVTAPTKDYELEKHVSINSRNVDEYAGDKDSSNVTDMLAGMKSNGFIVDFAVGQVWTSGRTRWKVTSVSDPMTINDFTALGDVYVADFVDGEMTADEYVTMANDYCMDTDRRNRLVFDGIKSITFSADASFQVYVESGGWFCSGNCQLIWSEAPSAGYAVNVLGRYDSDTEYSTRVDDSHYQPLIGITIGEYGNQVEGVGLKLGYADTWGSSTGAVVTSKFKIDRVNVFDFDTVVQFWTGVWACDLNINTMGGSWETPTYFNGLDFGENIKLNHCFIADNHTRLVDGKMGQVTFSAGEWIVHGGSFDNMRVEVAGDSIVKMVTPHFENPSSTAKNKVFLAVTGLHAYCVIDSPTIAIRDTEIYSTLFYCVAGDDANRYPWSGGLVIKSPSYQSKSQYRPDLSPYKEIEDSATYESDGYLELVSGGGRVYLEGGVHINSLHYSYAPIPVARNLVGKSLYNHSFDADVVGESPSGWVVDSDAPNTGVAEISDDDSWVGDQCLKTTVDYNGGETWNSSHVYQELDCPNGALVLANIKCKWVTELTNDATGDITGEILVSLDFYDRQGNYLSTGWSESFDVDGDSSSDYDGWQTAILTGHAPAGASAVRMKLVSYSTSDSADKKIYTYWDTAVLNVL